MTKTLPVELNAYQLANLADINGNFEKDSSGAAMLLGVQGAILDMIKWEVEQDADVDADTLRDGVSDAIDGIAPSIYTGEKWQQFTDLAAYEEDLSEWAGSDVLEDLDKLSDLALWQIGDRLAYRIIEAWEESEDK